MNFATVDEEKVTKMKKIMRNASHGIFITVKTQVQTKEIKPASSLNVCRPKSCMNAELHSIGGSNF